MTQKIKLFCILDGDSSAFPVKLEVEDTIGELKKAIKEENPNDLQDVDADMLIIWRVSIPSAPESVITLGNLIGDETTAHPERLKDPASEISEVFGTAPAKKTIHVIVQRPLAVPAALYHPSVVVHSPSPPISRSSSPSQDLEEKVKRITSSFFAQGSATAAFLVDYVKGKYKLPVTTEGVKGLPNIRRRGKKDNLQHSQPSLLFLDLPTIQHDGSVPA
ncbi:hypothetical protein BGZ76_004608, partial [Entomortierella beljakovae]